VCLKLSEQINSPQKNNQTKDRDSLFETSGMTVGLDEWSLACFIEPITLILLQARFVILSRFQAS
jgi:hypothetical protein